MIFTEHWAPAVCKWRLALSMEKSNFRPPTESTSLNRSPKICHRWLCQRPLQLRQIKCTCIHGGGLLGTLVKYNQNNYFIYALLEELTYGSDPSTDFHASWLTGRGLAQGCAFWGFVQYAATLVHAFVTSRIDYCNALLANAPRTTTDKLPRVLNAAARVITGRPTRKFDRGLTHILHDELHWLDVPQSVTFELCVTVYKCLHGLAPQYLSELCVPVADVAGWPSPPTPLCKPRTSILFSLQHVKLRRQTRVFVRRPSRLAVWNLLAENVRKSTPIAIFKRSLKTFLFEQITHSAH